LLAGALLLAACGDASPPAAAGAPGGPLPAVTVIPVQSAQVAVIDELPGRTAPYLAAEVRPQVTGIIRERLFTEGSDVEAGQVLYRIDPAPYQAVVASARAALARAEASLEVARLKAQRYATLLETDAVSQQLYDEAAAAEKQAQAEVQAARAALDEARIELGYTQVAAPIPGRIGRSAVTPGALVTANQADALATVQQLDPIYVDFTQSSAELLALRRGIVSGRVRRDDDDTIPVRLVLEDGSEYGAEGRLAFSEVAVDPTTGSVTLRAVFPNPDGLLLPGMYVRARLSQGVQQDAILVPQAALSHTPRGEPQVMIVNADDTVEARVVEAERTAGRQWVVSGGLKPGERVIVEGLQHVRPGVRVQATVAERPATASSPAAEQAAEH
jgi:membrane fusion protein (multidrug efflux system)